MKPTNELLRQALAHIELFFSKGQPDNTSSPWYTRTLRLLQQCNTVGMQAELSKDDLLTVQLASLFLYAGYASSPDEDFTKAAQEAHEYYSTAGLDSASLEAVRECIISAAMPQMPSTTAAQVLCDAMHSPLADKGFAEPATDDSGVLLEEQFFLPSMGKDIKARITYLQNHIFFSPAARKLFDKGKGKNIERLQRKLETPADQESMGGGILFPEFTKPVVESRMERGAETLFRITSKRHTELMSMAHQKAGMLVSVNAIILSVILSVLSTKLQENPQLLLPTVLLILTCVSTIVISILTTKPKIVGGKKNTNIEKFSEEKNILFFGHYAFLPWADYRKILKKTIVGKETLFDALAKDVYYQGVVLDKKYRLLSMAYIVFLTGLILSTLAFMISFF